MLNGRQDVAAAYSMRRLRSDYSGALVRIRRSSDSTESDFGAGYAWLDWNAILAFIGAGDGFATTFYDQSGSGRNLLQATAAAQPQIILASNGRPALLFDGVDDFMQTAAFTASQPLTAFTCFRRVANLQAALNYLYDTRTLDQRAHYATTVGAQNNLYAGVDVVTDAPSQPVGTRGVVAGVFNGASSRVEVNAASISSFTGSVGVGNGSGITLGAAGGATGAFWSNIEIQEHVLLSTAQSQANCQAMNAAIRAAWGF